MDGQSNWEKLGQKGRFPNPVISLSNISFRLLSNLLADVQSIKSINFLRLILPLWFAQESPETKILQNTVLERVRLCEYRYSCLVVVLEMDGNG